MPEFTIKLSALDAGRLSGILAAIAAGEALDLERLAFAKQMSRSIYCQAKEQADAQVTG